MFDSAVALRDPTLLQLARFQSVEENTFSCDKAHWNEKTAKVEKNTELVMFPQWNRNTWYLPFILFGSRWCKFSFHREHPESLEDLKRSIEQSQI